MVTTHFAIVGRKWLLATLALAVLAGTITIDKGRNPIDDGALLGAKTSGELVLAFEKAGTYDTEILLVDAQSGRLHVVKNRDPYVGSPTASPQGDRLAFVSNAKGNYRIQIRVTDRRGRIKKRFELGEYDWDCLDFNPEIAWSPTGAVLAVNAKAPDEEPDSKENPSLWTLDIKTGRTKVLVKAEEADLRDQIPAWHPDGRSLLFCKDGWVYSVPSDGGPPQRICQGYGPGWAADGKRLSCYKEGYLCIYDPAAGSYQRLCRDELDAMLQPLWSPDGKYILVGLDEYRGLALVDTSTGQQTVICEPGQGEFHHAFWRAP